METTAQKHIRIYDEAKSVRLPLEQYWQDLTYYCLPRKAYITRIKNLGDKLPTDIYDSTAIMANTYFAAGMQAYMSSPQTKWFTLGLKNRALLNNKRILDYLNDTQDVLYDIINSSNFYQEDVEGYLNHGSIGTDALYVEDDLLEDVRFNSIPIENIIIITDAQGRPAYAYLEFEYNASQAITKFGKDKCSEKIKESFNKSEFNKKFKFLFCVFPREVYDASKKDSRNMPYATLWIEREAKQILSEGGYRRFPFCVSRFAKSKGDPYGYSPAMNIFPDIKMINAMEKTNILGAQMSVLPPKEIPDEAFLRPYNFNPGGFNIKNAGFPDEHIVPINSGANVPLGLEYVKYKENKIAQAFFNDLFIMLQEIGKNNMTAYEVSVRNNQRMQLLGSAIGNIMREKLSPVIERIYEIAALHDKLPPLPPELEGQQYIIMYISPLARAQKALEMTNFQSAIGIIASLAQVNPEVFDKIDFDKAVDYVGEVTNVTPKVLRDDAEVEQIRANRQEQQVVAAQLELLQKGTEAVKTGAEADVSIKESQASTGVK